MRFDGPENQFSINIFLVVVPVFQIEVRIYGRESRDPDLNLRVMERLVAKLDPGFPTSTTPLRLKKRAGMTSLKVIKTMPTNTTSNLSRMTVVSQAFVMDPKTAAFFAPVHEGR